MSWIDLPQDRNKWNAFMNTVMRHRVPQNAVIFLVDAQLSASQKSNCSMEPALIKIFCFIAPVYVVNLYEHKQSLQPTEHTKIKITIRVNVAVQWGVRVYGVRQIGTKL